MATQSDLLTETTPTSIVLDDILERELVNSARYRSTILAIILFVFLFSLLLIQVLGILPEFFYELFFGISIINVVYIGLLACIAIEIGYWFSLRSKEKITRGAKTLRRSGSAAIHGNDFYQC